MNYFQKFYTFLLDILFPIECLNCGKEKTWLCNKCFNKLKYNNIQHCLYCRAENKFGKFCLKCKKENNFSLDGIWIAGDYKNEILAQLIKKFKYKFIKDISEILGKFLIFFLKNLIKQSIINKNEIAKTIKWNKIKNPPRVLFNLDILLKTNFITIKSTSNSTIIIPVPLHKRRQTWRGFNQSYLLAKIIAQNFNIELSQKLIRTKYKPPQTQLKKSEREKNIRNCFKWNGTSLKNRNIILVDDIITTGSTLNECAKILKQANAKKIWGLVVAKK